MNSADAPIFFKANSIIFTPGKYSKFLYLVKSGEVRILKYSNNHLTIVEVCKPGDILNEVSVLMNKPNDYLAISHSDIELVIVSASDISEALKQSPKWIPEIFKTMCDRLRDSEEIILSHNLSTGLTDPKLVLSKEDEIRYLALMKEAMAQ
jgi:CRP/FNR family cyclic AMP-dependent transcriptional regulator